MNKNFIKSSVKAIVVALFASAMVSCSKDQFTEKNALDLELQRLRAQRTIDSIKTNQDRLDRNGLLRYQRALDSLDRANAGGRVFYTVNVVSATTAAISNGRIEEAEGVTGATVTTSQFGRVTAPTTTTNGLATFEMRSGEATVSISAPGHTGADYTVNLTGPFSGNQTGIFGGASNNVSIVQVPVNGSTVYVGNVVPLFQVDAANATGSMATLRGRAFIETDLTNDVEEVVGSAAFNTAATAQGGSTSVFVSAAINTNATFFARFLGKTGAFGTSGTQNGGTSTSAGLGNITKLFYTGVAPAGGIPAGPGAGTGTTGTSVGTIGRALINATGDYNLLVPASVAGLPIVLKSDEIVAARTYFRDDAAGLGTLTTQRFLYGPNVTSDAVTEGASIPRVSFQAFTTPATVTTSYTAQVTSSSFNTGNYVNGVSSATTGTATAVSGGFYAVTPNVTVTGTTGTGLTAGTVVDAPTGTFSGNAAFVNVTRNAFANTPASTTGVGISVAGVEISAGGTGYVPVAGINNDGVATFTRNDVVVVGNGFRVGGATGSQIASFIQVTDGGFGFVYPQPATFAVANIGTNTAVGGFAATTTTSGFTGVLPVVSFGNILAPATSPVAFVIPEPVVGTITSINVQSTGTGLSSIPQPVFTYGTSGQVNATDVSMAGSPLFEQAGAGGIRFNFDNTGGTTAYQFPASFGVAGSDYTFTATSLTLTPTTPAIRGAQNQILGSGYVFTPTAVAAAVGGTFPSVTPANFTVTVYTSSTANTINTPGSIARIDISAPGNYTAAGQTSAVAAPLGAFTSASGTITGISLQFVAPSTPPNSARSANSLAGLAFAGGSGLALDNYVITSPTPTVTRGGIAGATATNIFAAATASGYPANATLVSAALLDPNAPISTALASNLLAGSPWIVAFDPPTGGGSQAWGIPYIDLVNGISTISGVRIINAGAGYAAGTTSAIPMTLMPNPFRNTGATATVAAPAIALGAFGPANAANFFTAAFAVQAGVNLTSALANSGNIGFELPGVGASLTFTVTNAGAGYAAAPSVVIADGGLTFAAIAAALNPGIGAAAGSTNVGPVLMTNGAVTRVGNTFTGGAANQGRINFALGSDPMFLSNPATFVIDALSAGLTNAYNAAPNTPNNPFITIGANGAITGLGSQALTVLNQSRLPAAFVNSAAWPAIGFHQPPVVTVAAPLVGGTAATAVIDPAGVETLTSIPGIIPTGTNGTAGVAAVAATGSFVLSTFVNTTGGDLIVNMTSVGGSPAATIVPAIESASAAGAAVGAAVGFGTGTLYPITVPAMSTVVVRTQGAASANGVAPIAPTVTFPTAVMGVTTSQATTAGVTGVAGTTLAAGTLPGKIQAIRVTAGGSGYGRGNLFQRWFTINNGINQQMGNGQNYVIIGSNLSTTGGSGTNGAAGGPQLGVAGSQFDVIPGVTYIRDIHYGTGLRID